MTSIDLRYPEQSNILPRFFIIDLLIVRFVQSQYFYNEEFDPGSGWTLATGLTHASRGASGCSNTPLATGARVSNTYPTCPLLGDSLSKERLIPDGIILPHGRIIKEFRSSMGMPPVGVWTVSQFQCGGPSSQNPYPSKAWWAVTPPTT